MTYPERFVSVRIYCCIHSVDVNSQQHAVSSVRLRAHSRCLIPVDALQCHKLLLYLSVYVRTVGSQPGTVKGSLWGDQPAPVWCNAKGYCRLSQDKWSSVPTHANCELPATAAVHKLCSCAVIYLRTYIHMYLRILLWATVCAYILYVRISLAKLQNTS